MQAHVLDRIPKQSLTGAVFDQLLVRIISGQFRAGDALPAERQLCAELGVSRTSVRQAMSRLVQLRLIAVRQGGETRVLDYRRTGGLELLPYLLRSGDGVPPSSLLRAGVEMRAAIAPEVARLAAIRGGAEVATALDPIVDAMVPQRGDANALQALSLEFWSIVVAGADNVAYQLAFNTLRDAFLGLREPIAIAMIDELSDRAGYSAIAHSIRARDGEAAASAARNHLARGMTSLTGLAGAARRSRKGS